MPLHTVIIITVIAIIIIDTNIIITSCYSRYMRHLHCHYYQLITIHISVATTIFTLTIIIIAPIILTNIIITVNIIIRLPLSAIIITNHHHIIIIITIKAITIIIIHHSKDQSINGLCVINEFV